MKKILVLIAMSLLAACGGGNSTPTAALTETAGKPTGVLNIVIADGTQKSLAAVTPGVKNIRIVITNSALSLNGQPFSVIQDTIPGAPLSFALPVSNGYIVEALSYNNDATTGLNTVLKYAMAKGVAVDGSNTSTATLSPVPVAATLILPTPSLIQGTKFNVLANFSTAAGRHVTPLSTNWYLPTPKVGTFLPFTNHTSAMSYSSSHILNAPQVIGIPSMDITFLGVFTVKSSLLNPGESAKKWTFNSPEATMTVTAPTTMTITPNF